MSLYNYNRSYELIVSKQQESTEAYIPFSEGGGNPTPSIVNPYITLTSSGALDYQVEKESISIKELHFEAVIDRSMSSSQGAGNTAVVKVYNLAETNKSFMCQENNNIILKAGYNPEGKDNPELNIIFTGQVDSYTVESMGNDVVTTLYCKDGHTPAKTVRVGLAIKAAKPPQLPSTYSDVISFIKKVWESNGIKSSKSSVVTDLASPPLLPPDEIELLGGYNFQGYLRDLCNQVCEDIGFQWYIDNSILYFEPKNTPKKLTRRIFVLTDELLLSLQDNKKNTKTTSTSSNKDAGVKLKTFVDSRFEVGNYFRVVYGEKKGDYLVTDISYKLSYYGGDWLMEVTAKKEVS